MESCEAIVSGSVCYAMCLHCIVLQMIHRRGALHDVHVHLSKYGDTHFHSAHRKVPYEPSCARLFSQVLLASILHLYFTRYTYTHTHTHTYIYIHTHFLHTHTCIHTHQIHTSTHKHTPFAGCCCAVSPEGASGSLSESATWASSLAASDCKSNVCKFVCVNICMCVCVCACQESRTWAFS
jgi:hypothetical protein